MTAPDSSHPLQAALRLAGFALAHALWSISDGEPLCPLAIVESGTKRELQRHEGETEPTVQAARKHLAASGADRWVLVGDGYITPVHDERRGDRQDALVADIVDAAENRRLGALVRYRRPDGARPFAAVGPVQLFVHEDAGLELPEPAHAALVEGLRSHPAHGELSWAEIGD